MTQKDLLPPRLLAWYPKAAIGSAVMESLVAHGRKDLNERMLKLVRIQASMSVSCPFCIDMNSFEYEKAGITEEEMQGLAGKLEMDVIQSFSVKERLAVQYARLISQTPVDFPEAFIGKLTTEFTEREIVILSSTAAQVNYWARMLNSLGVPPAGFSDRCEF
ncbi:MAG: carboxymuconolactone decarboxylase family protein [Bacillota bacterium]|nr:carboxymuconolactone decarboxylase family protein [Bacillota bacterium]